jgi:hypothetical protein
VELGNIITIVKRRPPWVDHLALIAGVRHAYTILVRKPLEKQPIRR